MSICLSDLVGDAIRRLRSLITATAFHKPLSLSLSSSTPETALVVVDGGGPIAGRAKSGEKTTETHPAAIGA